MIGRLNAALQSRYHIERELGQGGMAIVYLAEDLKHDRKVAMKVLKPELAAVLGDERFLAEIKTTANLQHPHILPLHDSGDADGFVFYVMPYIEGESLRERLEREGQLPVDMALSIAKDIASALQYAHEQGVVHRDIKPANILLSRGDPLVADFGIALAVSQAGGGRITETGLSLGTPHYMSPEQASGERKVDPRSDVYSLGAMLYEMLSGEPPYPGQSAQAVLARILTEEPRRVTELRRTIPLHVGEVIDCALEKLPADRFPTAEAFKKALEEEGFRHTAPQRAAGARAAGDEIVPSGVGPMYVSTGYIVYGHGGQALMAVSFDLETREVGSPTTVIPELTVYTGGAAQYGVSATGTLIYNGAALTGGATGSTSFAEVALDGTATPHDLSTGDLNAPRYSPDGGRIAYQDGSEIRIYDVTTGASPQLTDGGGSYPVWSRDGEYLYFSSSRDSTLDVDGFRRRADGSLPAEQIFRRPGRNWVRALSPGDSIVLVREIGEETGRDLLLLRMGPDRAVPDSAVIEPYLTAEWTETKAEISPDGRYLAYVSTQEGEPRVYVQTFPAPTGRRSVSPGEGTDPRWAPGGDAIYYRGGTTFYVVDVTTEPSFSVGPPRKLFDYPAFTDGGVTVGVPNWDVHPDGERFILTETREPGSQAAGAGGVEVSPRERLQDVYIVTNWFTELRALMGEGG